MTNRFLFHYNMGARGDFLGAVLLNQFYLVNDTNYSIPPIANKIVKVHGIKNIVPLIPEFSNKYETFDELFAKANELELIKIKIVAETFEEKLDVAYLGWVKSLSHGRKLGHLHLTLDEVKTEGFLDKLKLNVPWLLNAIDVDIPKVQDEDKDYLNEYDYIIKFDDLFNIDFLKEIYRKINNQPIPPFVIDSVKKNISIQDRPSKSQNFMTYASIYECHTKIKELIATLK